MLGDCWCIPTAQMLKSDLEVERLRTVALDGLNTLRFLVNKPIQDDYLNLCVLHRARSMLLRNKYEEMHWVPEPDKICRELSASFPGLDGNVVFTEGVHAFFLWRVSLVQF